jgi:hypothetical protein
MLSWREVDQRPITVQLLIQEQYEAMRDGNIAAAANSTWTGERWVPDRDYLLEWAPAAQAAITTRREKDDRDVLNHAVQSLCRLLDSAYIPHSLAVHNLRIQHMQKREASLEDIEAVRAEYQHQSLRARKYRNKRRRRSRPPPPAPEDQGIFERLPGTARDLGSRQVCFPVTDHTTWLGHELSAATDPQDDRLPAPTPPVVSPDTQTTLPSRSQCPLAISLCSRHLRPMCCPRQGKALRRTQRAMTRTQRSG